MLLTVCTQWMCLKGTARRLTVPASYVEGFWSPALLYLTKNRKLKHSVISASLSVQGTEGPFSLGRGLILDQRFLNLSIFLSFDRGSSPETTKATRWVALAWSCYAASCLARTPLSEG